MAISNMRAEPARELIESSVGIATLIGVLVFLYKFAVKLRELQPGMEVGVEYIAAPAIILFSIVAVLLFIYGTHSLGEIVCAWMKNWGFDPRPKTRYRVDHFGKRVEDKY